MMMAAMMVAGTAAKGHHKEASTQQLRSSPSFCSPGWLSRRRHPLHPPHLAHSLQLMTAATMVAGNIPALASALSCLHLHMPLPPQP
jgi:hypothetical protein